MGWISAHATHGISETHVSHHICSKIPHYNAYVILINGFLARADVYISWEASAAVKKFLASRNIQLEGAPGCWAEAIRVFRECKVIVVLIHVFEIGLITLFSLLKMRATSFSSRMRLD